MMMLSSCEQNGGGVVISVMLRQKRESIINCKFEQKEY